jgi:hypothetical protein
MKRKTDWRSTQILYHKKLVYKCVLYFEWIIIYVAEIMRIVGRKQFLSTGYHYTIKDVYTTKTHNENKSVMWSVMGSRYKKLKLTPSAQITVTDNGRTVMSYRFKRRRNYAMNCAAGHSLPLCKHDVVNSEFRFVAATWERPCVIKQLVWVWMCRLHYHRARSNTVLKAGIRKFTPRPFKLPVHSLLTQIK